MKPGPVQSSNQSDIMVL